MLNYKWPRVIKLAMFRFIIDLSLPKNYYLTLLRWRTLFHENGQTSNGKKEEDGGLQVNEAISLCVYQKLNFLFT